MSALFTKSVFLLLWRLVKSPNPKTPVYYDQEVVGEGSEAQAAPAGRSPSRLPGGSGSRRAALASTALSWALLLWVSCAVLLVAGVHRTTAVFLCALALTLGAVFRRQLVAGFGGVSILCGACALWSLLGVVPLPCAWVSRLSPSAAELWQKALLPLDGSPSLACHLSLAPAASLLEGAKFAAYAILTALASSHARRQGLARVLTTFLVLGSVVAFITIAHKLASAGALFGLYRPEEASAAGLLSVFLNPNSLAGFLNLALFCGLARTAASSGAASRLGLLAGVALCLSTVILTGSRGGVFCLVLGLAVVPLIWRRKGRAGGVVLPTAGAILFGTALAYLGSSASTSAQLFGDDVSKLLEVPKLMAALREYWAFGLGRGAFASMSAKVLLEPAYVTHSYVENFALSWLLEWGCVFGGGALLMLVWLLRPHRLNPAGSRHIGLALLGVVCVLGQNLLDLGLELPGLAGALFLLLGSLEGAARRGFRPLGESRHTGGEGGREEHPTGSAWPRLGRSWGRGSRRGLLAAVTWVGLAVSVPLAALAGPSLREERIGLRALALSEEPGLATGQERGFERALRRAMSRWPVDPYFPLVAAQDALRHGRDALPFAAAALRRAPTTGAVHLTVADALIARGARLQALIHLRHALAADPQTLNAVLARAPRCSPELERLHQLAPPTEIGAEFLVRLVHGAGRELSPQEKWQLLAWAQEIAPERRSVLTLEGDLLLESGSEAALARVREIARRLPDQPACDGLVFRARALAAERRVVEAVDLLEGCSACADAGHCAERRLLWAQELSDVKRLRSAEEGYFAALCVDPETCAAASERLGRLAGHRGDWAAGAKHLAEAVRRVPTTERLRTLTDFALRAGQVIRARHAYERFRELGGEDSDLAGRIGQANRGVVP